MWPSSCTRCPVPPPTARPQAMEQPRVNHQHSTPTPAISNSSSSRKSLHQLCCRPVRAAAALLLRALQHSTGRNNQQPHASSTPASGGHSRGSSNHSSSNNRHSSSVCCLKQLQPPCAAVCDSGQTLWLCLRPWCASQHPTAKAAYKAVWRKERVTRRQRRHSVTCRMQPCQHLGRCCPASCLQWHTTRGRLCWRCSSPLHSLLYR